MQKKIVSLTISVGKLLETIRIIAPRCTTKEALLTSIVHHNQTLQKQITLVEDKLASYKRRLEKARIYVSDQSRLVSPRRQKIEQGAALEIQKKAALSKSTEIQAAHVELVRINKEIAPLKAMASTHEEEIGSYKLWPQNEARIKLEKALPLCDQDEFQLLEEVNTVLDEATQLKITKVLASAMDDTDLSEPTSPLGDIKIMRGVIVETSEKRLRLPPFVRPLNDDSVL